MYRRHPCRNLSSPVWHPLGSVFTSELDLLHLSPVETDSLARYGISIQGLHPGSIDRGMVDLTHLISHLRYVKGAIPSTFSLLAVDASGRVSQPVTLSVDVSPVNLSIQSVSKAIIRGRQSAAHNPIPVAHIQ